MLRTSSLHRTLTRWSLPFAACAALAGCTITTYSPPPVAGQPVAAQPVPAQPVPAQPAAHVPATPRPATKPPTVGATAPVPRTPATPRPGATPSEALAPRITSQILFGNGNAGAFRGLAYVLPTSTTKLPDLNTMVPFATLFTDSWNITSQPFTGGFPGALAQDEWFAIRYEGSFDVPRGGGWAFTVESDDGAVLYVDGVKVVDNDGVHAAGSKIGYRSLQKGPHRLRLDYFQGTGPVALRVLMGDAGKEVLVVGTR